MTEITQSFIKYTITYYNKADSKVNLIARYGFSNEQAEAIVTMPLYKLSHTDELILEKEKEELTANIEYLRGILEDDKKLNEYDGPQRTPQAHITKALVVEVEHSVGKTAFLHRHKKKDGFSLQI